jgi:capsular polysaccharide biosynthesis protein
LSRKGSSRHSDLEDEVFSKLKNFKTINTSQLNFEDQVNTFDKAKHLISWHGSGLANLIWMNKGSKVVEIFLDDHINYVFQSLSSIKKIDYLRINEKDLRNNFEEVIIKINNFFDNQ